MRPFARKKNALQIPKISLADEIKKSFFGLKNPHHTAENKKGYCQNISHWNRGLNIMN